MINSISIHRTKILAVAPLIAIFQFYTLYIFVIKCYIIILLSSILFLLNSSLKFFFKLFKEYNIATYVFSFSRISSSFPSLITRRLNTVKCYDISNRFLVGLVEAANVQSDHMQVTQVRVTSLRVELLRHYLAVNPLSFERYRGARILSACHAYHKRNGRNCDIVDRDEQRQHRAELSLSARL